MKKFLFGAFATVCAAFSLAAVNVFFDTAVGGDAVGFDIGEVGYWAV